MREILTEILATVRRNKLRTALTGFAVTWGIFMLICLLGAGNGLIHANQHNNRHFLTNSMEVFGGTTEKAYQGLQEGRRIELNSNDIETTERHFVENIKETGASITQSGVTLSLGSNYVSTNINGVYPNQAEVSNIKLLHGRFINAHDNEKMRKLLVLSDKQAEELMPRRISSLPGRYVKAGETAFKVIGIYKWDAMGMNSEAYAPFNTVRLLYHKGEKADKIAFTLQNLKDAPAATAFEQHYRAVLNTNHHAAADDGSAIWVMNHFAQSLQMQKGLDMLRTALWVIGILTLLSGIVGVSNIMLISVKERTREIGIRKAIGARPLVILRSILVESIVITTFFGYVGMVLGVLSNRYMDATLGNEKIDTGVFEAMMFMNPTVDIGICINATLLMIIAGTVAGLVPAYRAAYIKPIEALRYE